MPRADQFDLYSNFHCDQQEHIFRGGIRLIAQVSIECKTDICHRSLLLA